VGDVFLDSKITHFPRILRYIDNLALLHKSTEEAHIDQLRLHAQNGDREESDDANADPLSMGYQILRVMRLWRDWTPDLRSEEKIFTFCYPNQTDRAEKTYPAPKPALQNLTFHFETGKMHALVGDNGCGKRH
jgi:ABC-type multidrug transport system fused ATPase/permease subunit